MFICLQNAVLWIPSATQNDFVVVPFNFYSWFEKHEMQTSFVRFTVATTTLDPTNVSKVSMCKNTLRRKNAKNCNTCAKAKASSTTVECCGKKIQKSFLIPRDSVRVTRSQSQKMFFPHPKDNSQNFPTRLPFTAKCGKIGAEKFKTKIFVSTPKLGMEGEITIS